MSFRRLVTVSIIPISIVMVTWATLGHAFFGLMGWTALLLIASMVSPALLVLMLLAKKAAPKYYDTQLKPVVDQTTVSIYLVLYGLLFLFGIFVYDFGDTSNSDGSLATLVLGRGFINTTALISLVLAGLIAVAIVVLYVHIYKANKALKKTNAKNQPAVKA